LVLAWRFRPPADLPGGNSYFNLHTATFPGGEIRGQLVLVPETSTLALAKKVVSADSRNATATVRIKFRGAEFHDAQTSNRELRRRRENRLPRENAKSA